MKKAVVIAMCGLAVLALVSVANAEEDYDYDDDVEVVDETVESKPAKSEDAVYRTLSENFNKLDEVAKTNFLKKKLDELVGADVYVKMKEFGAPAYDALHQATADDYDGELSTLKKLKAELHYLSASDGEFAKFFTNLYRLVVPEE